MRKGHTAARFRRIYLGPNFRYAVCGRDVGAALNGEINGRNTLSQRICLR